MKKITVTLSDEAEKVFNEIMYSLPGEEDGTGECTQNQAINYALRTMWHYEQLHEDSESVAIKAIQDYFKAKILSGDFKLNCVYSCSVDILIDGLYTISIWTDNPEQCGPYNHASKNFIHLPAFNKEETLKCWSLIEPLIEKHKA